MSKFPVAPNFEPEYARAELISTFAFPPEANFAPSVSDCNSIGGVPGAASDWIDSAPIETLSSPAARSSCTPPLASSGTLSPFTVTTVPLPACPGTTRQPVSGPTNRGHLPRRRHFDSQPIADGRKPRRRELHRSGDLQPLALH